MLHTALMALIAILVIMIGLLTILFIFLFCLTVVIAPLEKRYLRDLLPLPDENQECAAPRFDPGPHPYMDAVNELAGQMGFEFQGLFARATKGIVSSRAAFWLSRERDVAVVVGIAEAGPLRQKMTSLISCLADRYLVTTDVFGEGDISGLVKQRVLLHADFPELVKYHEGRLAQADEKPARFTASNIVEDMNAIESRCVQRLVERGYARYLDADHAVWSYTVKGGVHLYVRSVPKQLVVGLSKFWRLYRPRPGSRWG